MLRCDRDEGCSRIWSGGRDSELKPIPYGQVRSMTYDVEMKPLVALHKNLSISQCCQYQDVFLKNFRKM